MSWLGVKYALACRDPLVKGGARMVLVAVGARLERRRITTSPTSLGALRWLTLLSAEQVRRNLKFLEARGKVKRLTRGKSAVYALPEMAGPLFLVDDGDPVKMTDFVIDGLPEEIGRNARKVTGQMTGFRRRMTDFSGIRAGGLLLSKDVRTLVPPSTDEQEAAGFSIWFLEEYRTRRGFPYVVNRDAALVVVANLLKDRSADRLQAMAVLMFEAVHDPFITSSDYSLFVLQHKATYLEGIAVKNERAPKEAVG